MQVVIDTNVIVSALMNTIGIPARILASVLDGKLIISYDNRIIYEYFDVLSRKRFGFPSEIIIKMIDFFKREGNYVNAEITYTKFSDKSDKKFYEVFKSGTALFLITGNIKHFPKEAGIVTPKEFIEKEII